MSALDITTTDDIYPDASSKKEEASTKDMSPMPATASNTVSVDDYNKLLASHNETKHKLDETRHNMLLLVKEVRQMRDMLTKHESYIKKAQSSIQRINLLLKVEAINRVRNRIVPTVMKYWGSIQTYLAEVDTGPAIVENVKATAE